MQSLLLLFFYSDNGDFDQTAFAVYILQLDSAGFLFPFCLMSYNFSSPEPKARGELL